VAQDEETLRTTPRDGVDANEIATYPRGARGTALAEWTDGAGQGWLFVRMDAAVGKEVADPDDLRKTPLLGWMRARAVYPLSDTRPAGPLDSLAPFGGP
jgi:hypothetical protein